MNMKELDDAEEKDPFLKLCDITLNGITCVRHMLSKGKIEKAEHRLIGIEQELRAVMDLRRCHGTEGFSKE